MIKHATMNLRASTVIDEEEPPLLDDAVDDGISRNQAESDTSIMDEMVTIATKAKAAKRQQQEKERNSSSFGAGLKKGFFATAPSKKKSTRASTAKPQKLEVLDDASKEQKKASSLLVVKQGTDNHGRKEDAASSSFVFPEVQDVLKSMNQLNPKEWMDERFFAKLAKRPLLLQALQNPRFSQAMNELQQNPQAAIQKYQQDADVSRMLRDFMEFLGDHFEELGKGQEATSPAPKEQPQQKAAPSPAIVDLDEARRQAIANMNRSPDEEQQVQKIMDKPELLAVLSDVKFMEQLRRCQEDPRIFRQLSSDVVFAPKLRLLVQANMVKFA